jgi:hypothetical protein
MKATNSNPVLPSPLARGTAILATAAALLFAPCLHAQTPDPATKDQVSGKDLPLNHPLKEKLYTLKFEGGSTSKLRESLRTEFPSDNVVLSGSVERLGLPGFELRNVRLAEIGRTIEFLGEGQLRVEVTENAGSGTLWLIGPRNPAEAAASVKMRSVAAPNLFANEKALAEIRLAAEDLERRRLDMTDVPGSARNVIRGAGAQPLESQGIFAITGDEEGVAGLESLIKAAEQRLAESANAKAAELAANGPKMRAVLAPHVFAVEGRSKRLMDEIQETRVKWAQVNRELQSEVGTAAVGLPWVDIDPRKEQKVFVLIGAEAAIAGMESIIKAAEQLAAEEDALMEAKMEAIKRAKQKEADLKDAKEAAKEKKGDP